VSSDVWKIMREVLLMGAKMLPHVLDAVRAANSGDEDLAARKMRDAARQAALIAKAKKKLG
jgi:hypothetical protein